MADVRDNGVITWTTETRRLGDLIQWEQNPRQLTKDQAKRLERSLTKFGYSQLVEIEPDDTFLDGHQRDDLMKIMEEFGPDAQIECRVANRKFTLEERKEYIALKHEGAQGEWDLDQMHNLYEFDELIDFGFDEVKLESMGFVADEPEPEDDPGAQIDRAEELREKWGVETGQLWRLGDHRLICGDCTDAAVVARVMDGEIVELLVTDIPYNLGDVTSGDTIQGDIISKRTKQGEWDSKFNDEFIVNLCIQLIDNRKSFYVCCSSEQMGDFLRPLELGNTCYGGQIVFEKTNPISSMRKVSWRRNHENVAWARHKESYWNFIGQEEMLTVQRFGNVTNTGHPTAKPPSLFERFIIASCQDNGIVYDPFLGSGTTLIACERLNRKCRAVEISPAYCAVAIQRWVDMTGGEPELISED